MPFAILEELLENFKQSPAAILLEKTEVARKRLIQFLILFTLVFIGFSYFSIPILKILEIPLLEAIPTKFAFLHFQSPLDGVVVLIKVAFICTLVTLMPLGLWFILRLIQPAISKSHQRLILPFYFSGLVLFFAGSTFCYWLVLPPALNFLVTFGLDLAQPMLMIDDYISMLMMMILGFGTAFQLPLVLILLGQLGLVSSSFLIENRSIAIVLNLIIAAILTPTPDPMSQLTMAIPMCLLYEVSILIMRRLEKTAE